MKKENFLSIGYNLVVTHTIMKLEILIIDLGMSRMGIENFTISVMISKRQKKNYNLIILRDKN